MVRLIVEGVAGTGKTSIISSFKKHPELKDALFISEKDTLGELFTELRDKSLTPNQHIKRLQLALTKLESMKEPIVLERFHHSYFALDIPWDLLQSIDMRLSQLSFKTALLDFNDSELISRSLKRKERASEGWEIGFLELYGNEEAAVNAFRRSQHLRYQSLDLSQLKSKIFNTDKMNWDQIATNILEFALSE